MLRRAVFCFSLALATGAVANDTLPSVKVYGPTVCLACIDWTEHLRQNGFTASFHGVADMAAVKRRLGVPVEVQSTLSAEVGGYFIEGHVPADDIKQLLQEKPRARGLAVPGLPRGAPGFDKSSPFCEQGCTILDSDSAAEPVVRRELYNTLLVEKDGKTRVWARH
jgi:hypothetical protein